MVKNWEELEIDLDLSLGTVEALQVLMPCCSCLGSFWCGMRTRSHEAFLPGKWQSQGRYNMEHQERGRAHSKGKMAGQELSVSPPPARCRQCYREVSQLLVETWSLD